VHTPAHTHAEALSAVWKQAHRRRLTEKQAKDAERDLYKAVKWLNTSSTILDSERALELSVDHGVSTYDTLYIAAAERLEATLLTADEDQQRIAKSTIRTLLIG
jgi:predicted nucleic acid-binding protein